MGGRSTSTTLRGNWSDWAIAGPFDPKVGGRTAKLPWRGVGWYLRRALRLGQRYPICRGATATDHRRSAERPWEAPGFCPLGTGVLRIEDNMAKEGVLVAVQTGRIDDR